MTWGEEYLTISRASPPPAAGPSKPSFQARRPTSMTLPLTSSIAILPYRVSLPTKWKREGKEKGDIGFRLTRRSCENGLLLGAVGFGVWKLGWQWNEKALAGGELTFRRDR